MMKKLFAKGIVNFGALVHWNTAALVFALPGILWTILIAVLFLGEFEAGQFSWELEGYSLVLIWLMGMVPLWGIGDIGEAGACAALRDMMKGKGGTAAFFSTIRRRALIAWPMGILRGLLLLATLVVFDTALVYADGFVRVCAKALPVVMPLLVFALQGVRTLVFAGKTPWHKAVGKAYKALPGCLMSVTAINLLLGAVPLCTLLIPAVGPYICGIYYLTVGFAVRLFALEAICAPGLTGEN